MIHTCSFSSGMDYVELEWTRPKFPPQSYTVTYLCSEMNMPHSSRTAYVHTMTQQLSSEIHSIRIFDLRPSSICTVNLVAVYNPASIDSGIVLNVTTLAEDGSKKGSFRWFIDNSSDKAHLLHVFCSYY